MGLGRDRRRRRRIRFDDRVRDPLRLGRVRAEEDADGRGDPGHGVAGSADRLHREPARARRRDGRRGDPRGLARPPARALRRHRRRG